MMPEPASKAPSSPASETEPDSGTTSYTGVIRPAGDAERANTYLHAISGLAPRGKPGHWVKFSTRHLIANACMALADAEHAALTADLLAQDAERLRLGAEIARLTRVIQTILDTSDANLSAKDATIERLWRELNEATNVPDAPAGPCQSCDQPASTHYHLIGGGCMNSEINAADDRRAL